MGWLPPWGRKKNQEGGVAFLDAAMGIRLGPAGQGIEGAEGVGAQDVLFDPGAGGEGFVATQIHAAVAALALVDALGGAGENVMKAGEVGADPGGEGVLVIDVIDTEPGEKVGQFGGAAGAADFVQSQSQVGLPAPDAEVERVLRGGGIDAVDEPPGSGGAAPGTEGGEAAVGLAGVDQAVQMPGLGLARSVPAQAGKHLGVGVDELMDQVWAGPGIPQFARGAGGGGQKAFQAEAVAVNQQADQGLGVVGIAADVGHDAQPGAQCGHGGHKVRIFRRGFGRCRGLGICSW